MPGEPQPPELPFTWKIAGLALALFVVGMFLIGLGTARQQADIVVRRAAIDEQLRATTAAAGRAAELAQHDRAVVFAVCRAFARRDDEDARHALIIERNVVRYGPALNAVQRANEPEVARHTKVLLAIAYSLDCRKLMEKALSEAPRYSYPPIRAEVP